ncbi:hypothetical protein M2352_002297 [Azospirillum fermentarium]|uniref:hypothetical protein n=1 Tax=Azospirillum fermentarium TaxID=1233114 RepID=UPI002225E7CE|nr:hypothetical protein [Azospirillum fermentarium]MCW2246706.1 hypothetical protein [Azospirillum fermentarium]
MACLSSVPNGVSSPVALRARRLPLLMLGAVSLMAGLLTGLARLGVPVPLLEDGAAGLALLHGPLMVGGFFGTVIGLERAAALGRAWVYGGPLATGLGGVLLAVGAPVAMGAGLMAFGAAILTAASVMVWQGHRAGFTAVMAGAAACWLLGTLLWLAGVPVAGVVLWWLLFLVLTIAGERLELSRFRPPSRWAVPAFAVTVGALVLGAALVPLAGDAGWRLAGAGMLALAGWLARFDIARRTVRGVGLVRYVALCLLTGYGWLAVGGALALAGGDPVGGPLYDAVLHAVFLGFVLAMVFGHAPVILPAVLRVAVPYRPALYLPLAVLHGGVALRVGGVLADDILLRQAGALTNGAALVLFIATMLTTILMGRRAA